MVIFKNAEPIAALFSEEKKKNKVIGFVPTMGALHKGHTSLIEACKKQSHVAVCSIFINPAQFNNPEDFKHYPITIEKDVEALINAGCDVLFLPSVDEIYPPDYKKKAYDLGKIETILEGHYRPGHFQGVCQVMDRLLEIVQPDKLFMGQKDYQQCLVVRKLIQLLGKENECELIVASTVREENGLAMSSRNLRLSPEDRKKAIALSNALAHIKKNIGQLPIDSLKADAADKLKAQGFEVDYVEVADGYTLEPATDTSKKLVALTAATINGIRLIDNMVLN